MERNKGKKRIVVCAANRSKVTGKIICGARHWDNVMRGQVEFLPGPKMPPEWVGAEQGFIDQFGVWMNREEAWKVAEESGQIKPTGEEQSVILFSEDLY